MDQIVRRESAALGGSETLSQSAFAEYEAQRMSEAGTGWARASSGLTDDQAALTIDAMTDQERYWYDLNRDGASKAFEERNLSVYRRCEDCRASRLKRKFDALQLRSSSSVASTSI
jgi:hypothetical protein